MPGRVYLHRTDLRAPGSATASYPGKVVELSMEPTTSGRGQWPYTDGPWLCRSIARLSSLRSSVVDSDRYWIVTDFGLGGN